jgi:hypothetical protein
LYLINIHWGRSLCVFSFSLLTSHHILHNDCYKCLFNFFHLSDSIFPLVTYLVISSTKKLEIIFHLCFMKSKKFSILPHFLSSMCPFSCERYFFLCLFSIWVLGVSGSISYSFPTFPLNILKVNSWSGICLQSQYLETEAWGSW